MNPELQKSLQVTPPTNTLDSYMLMILLIMVVAGILGGVANYYLSDRQGEPVRRDWAKYLILGVISALTVPLFLNMLSSNLLEAARTRPVDFFVFAGFCLIYVVASRRFFENVANRLLPVSYTHLDVYKRQGQGVLRGVYEPVQRFGLYQRHVTVQDERRALLFQMRQGLLHGVPGA